MFHHLNAGTERRFVQGALHLGTAAISSGMHDPLMTMSSLAGERDIGTPIGVECSSEPHQVTDRGRGLGNEFANHRLIAKAGTSNECVAHVVFKGILRIEHTGQSALSPCRRTRRQAILGDHQHRAHRPSRKSSGKAGSSRADHHHIDVALP